MGRWKLKSVSAVADGNKPGSSTENALVEGLRVAIVGSGPAGIFCADRLAELAQKGEANISGAVQLFRSRSKLSASQVEDEHNTIFPHPGAPFFDYGCQYITAGDLWFKQKMQAYEKAGLCHQWPVGVLSCEDGYEPIDHIPGWAGERGMWVFQERVVEYIAAERGEFLKLHHAVDKWPPAGGDKWLDSTSGPNANQLMVTQFEKCADGTWILRNRRGDTYGPFDVLIGAYCSHAHTDQQLCGDATQPVRNYLHKNLRFAPLIVAWVIFEHPLELDFNAAFVVGDDRLTWVSNNNAKVGEGIPFAAAGREFWTLISSTRYSIRSVAKDARGHKRRALVDMITAFGKFVGKDLWSHSPKLIRANHWGGAVPCTTLPSDSGCIFDSAKSLGWCGAWATYGCVEGAAVSGKQMAELIASLSQGGCPPVEADYPSGAWPDMGCRATDRRVCLSHGFFHVKHPRLRNTMLVPGLCPEPDALHHCLEGWNIADPSHDTDVTSDGTISGSRRIVIRQHDHDQQKLESNGCISEVRGKEKGKAISKRRWVPVQTVSHASESPQGGHV